MKTVNSKQKIMYVQLNRNVHIRLHDAHRSHHCFQLNECSSS